MDKKREDFTITLTNGDTLLENKNNSDFNTILNKPIILDDDLWEVGLIYVKLRNDTFTIDGSNNVIYLVIRNPKIPIKKPNGKIVYEEVTTGITYNNRRRYYDYRNMTYEGVNDLYKDNMKTINLTNLLRNHSQ